MPTLIYQYGARLDKECLPEVNRQFFLANQLYNNIVAIIRATREKGEKLLRSKSREYDDVCTRLEKLNEDFREAKASNDEERMKAVRAQEKPLREARGAARKAASTACKDELAEIYSAIGETSSCETFQAKKRAEAEGLFWSTAECTLKAALQAWMKVKSSGGNIQFRKFAERTQDQITVRFTDAGGAPVSGLIDGRHGMISLAEPGIESPAFNGARGKYHPGFKFRIGSAKSNSYATGTWLNHRPFPEGATVTTCRLVRRRIGPDVRWSLQFQLSVESTPTIETGQRKPFAAAHFGWSLSDEGFRRIAAIVDENDPGFAQFVDLPLDIGQDIARAALIQQERDTNRDDLHLKLKRGIDTHGWLEADHEELAAIIKLPAAHVPAKRLCRLARMLRESGTENDVLADFARDDRKLYQAERHIDTRARNRRRNFYRNVALDWVKRYEVIVLSMPNLKDAALRIKETGERSELGQSAREARHNAALYEFRQCLNWAAERAGTAILEADGFSHAKTCAICGADIERVDDFAMCPSGHSGDTKANSAARLFQENSTGFAQKAAAAMALISEKKAKADAKKADKLSRMQAKRAEVRANSRDSSVESVSCAA